MKVVVADDDPTTLARLVSFVTKWGHEPIPFTDGSSAMMAFRSKDAPLVAIMDWVMPGLDGIEICRRLREVQKPTYVLLLTGRTDKESLLEGLEAGANDYLVKPFDKDELRVRLNVGIRYAQMQEMLNERVKQLERALDEIRDLKARMNMPL